MTSLAKGFVRLPTGAKILLIVSAVLLPIGLALMWVAQQGIREANAALRERFDYQARTAARSIESLIARNALALRIAANSRPAGGSSSCGPVRQSLAIAPAITQRFELSGVAGERLCAVDEPSRFGSLPLVAPGDIRVRISDDGGDLVFRVGVIGGMATGILDPRELRQAVVPLDGALSRIELLDGARTMELVEQRPAAPLSTQATTTLPIANGALQVRVEGVIPKLAAADQLMILLPLLMWVAAALITWLLVTRILIRPLRRLERAVIRFQPGDSPLVLPRHLGPATEIQELRNAFARAVARVEQSEAEMAAALDGQRRLVREVHHRVKNNLQVVASLLNIHGRNADSDEARAAYSSIGRRVGALSIVHRNHFAEMEENRGIALRPLLAELVAELRAGAPPEARGLTVELELEAVHTTQDVAVSIAFLITEILEFAMLNRPQDLVEVDLRRLGDLTARLTMGSPVLVPAEADAADKAQFERIIAGLAKQLRSPLERKLGRYSVDLPIFPPA